MSKTDFDRSEYPELLQLLHDQLTESNDKLDTVNKFIETHYPNGLDVGLKKKLIMRILCFTLMVFI